MEIAAPQLLRESAASADPVRMTRDEEIADASFRAADFASLDREHLSAVSYTHLTLPTNSRV